MITDPLTNGPTLLLLEATDHRSQLKKLDVRGRWVGGMVVVLGENNKSLSDSIRIG